MVTKIMLSRILFNSCGYATSILIFTNWPHSLLCPKLPHCNHCKTFFLKKGGSIFFFFRAITLCQKCCRLSLTCTKPGIFFLKGRLRCWETIKRLQQLWQMPGVAKKLLSSGSVWREILQNNKQPGKSFARVHRKLYLSPGSLDSSYLNSAYLQTAWPPAR